MKILIIVDTDAVSVIGVQSFEKERLSPLICFHRFDLVFSFINIMSELKVACVDEVDARTGGSFP